MVDEQRYLEAILNGTFHIRRFTRKEQAGSSDAADRFLWLAILRAELELAGEESAGLCGSAAAALGTAPHPSRFLTTLADALQRHVTMCGWFCGASVEDAGRRMFALVKTALDPSVILNPLPRFVSK